MANWRQRKNATKTPQQHTGHDFIKPFSQETNMKVLLNAEPCETDVNQLWEPQITTLFPCFITKFDPHNFLMVCFPFFKGLAACEYCFQTPPGKTSLLLHVVAEMLNRQTYQQELLVHGPSDWGAHGTMGLPFTVGCFSWVHPMSIASHYWVSHSMSGQNINGTAHTLKKIRELNQLP